jgi:ribose transport system substrate-binding protein
MRGRAVVVIAILGALMVGCGGGSSDEQGVNGSPQPPFKVALAMSYVGSDWQIEAKNLVNAEAKTPPYDRLIKLDNYVAGAAGAGGADVERQIEQMQQMIAKGYDAIIAFPISPTALNPVVKQACERGVVVIAYDAELTEPCAYNVHINRVAAGKFTARGSPSSCTARATSSRPTACPGRR